MKVIKSLVIVLLMSSFGNTFAADEEYPGRKKFPDVKIYTQSKLKTNYNKVIIVDARSELEFDTLRIKSAINIPVSSKTFKQQIKALRAKTSKPIVFYCNGHTCFKSYIAVRKAHFAKVKNVYAYDEGLFAWAHQNPKQAILLGQSPVNPKRIISKSAFKSHLLEPAKFIDLAHKYGSKTVVLDVRDKYQRGATGFFPGIEKWVSLNDKDKLNAVIKKAAKEKRTLFIYDEVGKQVRWLQYALEQNSIKNYYFMKKGAKGYYQEMMQELGIGGKSL